MQLTGAEIVIECLKEQGVDTCIWISGRSNFKCIRCVI